MRLLVVEDEKKIADSIKKGLVQEGYSVDVSYSGDYALDLILSEEYDLIILDRMLPKIDGIKILEKAREKNIHSPILFLTAKAELEDKVEGLNLGADDYLSKPFAFEELLARVKALARRPRKSIGNKIRVGDLVLDTNLNEVKRKNKEILLTRKEFSLLKYLMLHKGQIVSKQQILDHVWNFESDVLPNSVEVYIKHLRDKIDKKDFAPLLKTVRGFGYKIG